MAARLHAFAARLGMARVWFELKPDRPEHDHHDLTRAQRERARSAPSTSRRRDGVRRRRRARDAANAPRA